MGALELDSSEQTEAFETQQRMSYVVDKEEVKPEQFPLVAEGPTVVTRWDLPDADAFVLDGVLTPDECATLIRQADEHWSYWDSSGCSREEFRNCHTVEVTHQEAADRIWARIADHVNPPMTFDEDEDPDLFEVDIEGTWEPYGVNPTLLLGRYLNGGHFSPHTDGTTVVDLNRRTMYSGIIYLNSSPWGGETRVYRNEMIGRDLVKDEQGRLTGDPELVIKAVEPKPGRMLIMYHRLMHEGVPAAEKYIIRTDVLYRRTPEICTAPEDKEAFQLYQEAELRAENGECMEAQKLFRRAFKLSPALAKVYRS